MGQKLIKPEFHEEIWKSGDHFISLIREDNTHFLYSENCKNKKCAAIIKTKNVSLKRDDKTIHDSSGKNPGSVICKKIFNQVVFYLKDIQGNENTFCLFPDKSFISSSSLFFIDFTK